MSKARIEQLAEFGQSVWLDSISRSLIETGKLKEMIESSLRGMTSNPTIFDKAKNCSMMEWIHLKNHLYLFWIP